MGLLRKLKKAITFKNIAKATGLKGIKPMLRSNPILALPRTLLNQVGVGKNKPPTVLGTSLPPLETPEQKAAREAADAGRVNSQNAYNAEQARAAAQATAQAGDQASSATPVVQPLDALAEEERRRKLLLKGSKTVLG